MKSKINKEWHQQNRMPAHPTFEQRVEWHLAHKKNCSCRPMPQKLLDEMKKAGINADDYPEKVSN